MFLSIAQCLQAGLGVSIFDLPGVFKSGLRGISHQSLLNATSSNHRIRNYPRNLSGLRIFLVSLRLPLPGISTPARVFPLKAIDKVLCYR